MEMIQNERQLFADIIDFDEDDTREEIQRVAGKAIYKGTECGAWIHIDDEGIQVGSIVEGSDAEVSRPRLKWGEFTRQDFWHTVQAVNDEACMLWEEANAWDDEDD